ncbi:flagellar biosynthesis anti-sigma factor FlgM [Idiomarina seosinensis]|uniref:Negative regulator of flagellin synthesis n=1 Tax=Idiomarina seosinensis TaxID=281739 RepID=A0A432ZGA0_9GAMM|nr:flagellar biosynthesis anti-sigma factor FlgM [Idiomarina seosinensis]RUO77025.1 flagellar biosynthesis anti-sigma factor FlgM [Idiomarina seosinensis]
MPINVNNTGLKNTNIDTKNSRQVEQGQNNSSPAPAQKGGGDSVSLTSEAQQLNSLQEKAMSSSGIDQSKVDRIKTQIENGSYSVDVDRLASKLAQFEGDLFGGQIGSDE